jgi:16S rRNA (cytosine967-C5)-methyltransferase
MAPSNDDPAAPAPQPDRAASARKRRPAGSGKLSEGVAARRLALTVIERVLRTRRPLDEIFAEEAASADLPSRDAALARAIVVVSFRRRGSIRAALAKRMREAPKDARIGILIEIVAAQVLYLDVPDHAAVASAVALARGDRALTHFAGLVNALGRRLARDREAIEAETGPLEDLPDWLAERWIAAYGREETEAMAAIQRREAPLDLTLRDPAPGDAVLTEWAERLDARLLPTGSLRLTDRRPVQDLPGYEDGAWFVQDAAARIPARLLVTRAGERVADLCAAPGGKTAQLAATGAEVMAVDRSAKRLERVRENLERLGLDATLHAGDVLDLDDGLRFDAILLDAPCSATGTLRRHPDVAWIKTPQDIAKLAGLQRRLIDKAVSLLNPGGRLVYCTCSLEPEEGEEQAAYLLATHPAMRRLPVSPDEIGDLDGLLTPQGDFRALPHRGGTAMPEGLDGFFAARFHKP